MSYRRIKRPFDVLCTLLAVVSLSPLIALVSVLVRLKLGSPVLFIHERAGRDGRPFRLLKFRTMLDARDGNGEVLVDSLRLTPFGSALRRTSLDELPELINVLKGDMSLVGPRPLPTDYLPLYSTEESRRHSVRPGITGWAQINGRNQLPWAEKLALDVWYVDHQSFRLDALIVFRTLTKVWRSEGITDPGVTALDPWFTAKGEPPASTKTWS
jgi:sugar transferase EpsL